MRKPKLAVCYAWTSDFIYTAAAENMANLQHPEGWDVRFIRGTGWCPARRHNDFFEKSLAWGADYVISIGSDQIHPEDLLPRMIKRIEEGCQIITALVPMRGYVDWQGDMKPFQLVGWRLEFGGSRPFRGMQYDIDMCKAIDPADGDVQPIHLIGSGCMMFHTDLLKSLKKPWCIEHVDPETMHRTGDMDTSFVWKLQTELGAKLWVDTTIKIKHLHVFAIDDTFSERFADWKDPKVADLNLCKFQDKNTTVGGKDGGKAKPIA